MSARPRSTKRDWSAGDLIAFEREIAEIFNAGKIPAPVHLAGGNEHRLISVFQDIAPDDWVLCSWRSHYHCLLKGVPPAEVGASIIKGRSIALCFPQYRVLSSAIVGGICPLATGLAWSIKQRRGRERVHCFLGDMSAMTGIYQECRRYCAGHDLPVHWVIEDNSKSVCTDTIEAWGRVQTFPHVTTYQYDLDKPHVGTGQWVRF